MPVNSTTDGGGDVEMADAPIISRPELRMARQLLFRCLTCKRVAHYEHLAVPSTLPKDAKLTKIAGYYQHTTHWLCGDCASFRYDLDKIIAWRPYPANSPATPATGNYKDQLPREYLVKWDKRSYRRLSWVPHMWLVSTNPQKLKNFLASGTKVELLNQAPGSPTKSTTGHRVAPSPLDPLPNAEQLIFPNWKTVDRVLDVVFYVEDAKSKGKAKGQAKRPSTRGGRQTIISDDEDEDVEMDDVNAEDIELPEELLEAFELGEEPDSTLTMGVEEYVEHKGDEISEDDAGKVVWGFFKWGDLGYEEGRESSPSSLIILLTCFESLVGLSTAPR